MSEVNPVNGYADTYRAMARQGVQKVLVWSVIADLERNIAPHYDALAAQRDEGLAREAELKQRLAEAEKLLRETLEFYDDGVGRDDEHGNHIEWDFWQKIHSYFGSPGCADGEQSECAHSYANKLGCPECGEDFGK